MNSRKDDIAHLFKRFGGDEGAFREFSRDAEAHVAGERWPLLQNIPLKARVASPVLSEEQKQSRLAGRDNLLVTEEAPAENGSRSNFPSALNRLVEIRCSEVERASLVAEVSAPPRQEAVIADPEASKNYRPAATEPLPRPSAMLFGEKKESVSRSSLRQSSPLLEMFSRLEGNTSDQGLDKRKTGLFGRQRLR